MEQARIEHAPNGSLLNAYHQRWCAGEQMVYHDRVYIFIQLLYNKNDHLAK